MAVVSTACHSTAAPFRSMIPAAAVVVGHSTRTTAHPMRTSATGFERYADPANGESGFAARHGAMTVVLTENRAIWRFRNGAPSVGMEFVGATARQSLTALGRVRGVSHYFLGADPAAWRTAVEQFDGVRYPGMYPGIDVEYDASGETLEYGFVVAPYSDASVIRMRFDGADQIEINRLGDLVLHSGGESLRQPRPSAYQESGSSRQSVDVDYILDNDHTVRITVGPHDPARRLVIDPLVYSTYLGGSGNDDAWAISVDAAGNAYVVGGTNSSDFPTLNALQGAVGGPVSKYTMFITKFDSSGQLVYSTYLGGDGGYGNGIDGDFGNAVAVDASGNAYIAGSTSSSNFPTTLGAFQVSNGGACSRDPGGRNPCVRAFVVKLDTTGKLAYSTYLGGTGGVDSALGMATGPTGDAYLTGWTRSQDFPVTPSAFQPNLGSSSCSNDCDGAFVTRLNATGTALVYSTYLGPNFTTGAAIAVDKDGNAYITGLTSLDKFPTTPGAFQPTGGLMFVTKLNPTGTGLVFSSRLGSAWPVIDESDTIGATGIAVDGGGNVYVTGYTHGTNHVTTPGVVFPKPLGSGDAFVTKINADGTTLEYSTFLGGSGDEGGNAIAVDQAGHAYITGWTSSRDFPVTESNLQAVLNQGTCDVRWCANVFITRLAPDASAVEYSTYLGGSSWDEGHGIAVDASGSVYVAGSTTSANFPTADALQATSRKSPGGSRTDAFASKVTIGIVQPARLLPKRR